MKQLFTAILIFWVCSATWSQMTPSQLLATAWDDPTVQLHREQQAYLENTDFNLPLLRKLELRTETRDLDPKQQEYALRIGTNSFGMKRTQSAIYGSMKELTEAERQRLVQDALLDRYELLLDVHFSRQTLALLERQRQVLLDKKTVYSQQLALGLQDDLDDFFRTEDDLLQLEQKIFEAKSEATMQRLRLKIFTGKEDSVMVGEMVRPAALLAFVGGANNVTPPSVQRRQAQAALALEEEKMGQMEGRNLLNYLQFRYTGNAKDLLEDRFSVGAGFDLPWPNGSKLKQQELHLETLKSQAEAEAERQKVEQAVQLKSSQWAQLWQRYDFLEKQAATFREQYDPQRLHASGLENPETLLRVQESIARLELDKASVEKDIYRSYLSLLAETGLLTAEPARNYLSPGLELISR